MFLLKTKSKASDTPRNRRKYAAYFPEVEKKRPMPQSTQKIEQHPSKGTKKIIPQVIPTK